MDKKKKYKCLWCNSEKNKEDLSVIYGNNKFFNKSFFYSCKGNHIENLKKYLEKTEKYYTHSFSSILVSLIIYPSLIIILKKYQYWISIFMSFDFGTGLFFFPFSTPGFTEKFGVKKTLIILRAISLILILSALILLLRIV